MTNPVVREDASVASPIACRIASTTRSSARPAGRIRRAARQSTSPARPCASHRWRRCLTVLAGTGLPAADSSAAFALSRSVRLVRSGSYSGLGRVPAGASGRSP